METIELNSDGATTATETKPLKTRRTGSISIKELKKIVGNDKLTRLYLSEVYPAAVHNDDTRIWSPLVVKNADGTTTVARIGYFPNRGGWHTTVKAVRG